MGSLALLLDAIHFPQIVKVERVIASANLGLPCRQFGREGSMGEAE